MIAQKIGQETLLPSLQLAIEDPGANSSNCGEGYSCAYTNSISWATPTQPLPMELNPQVVFERLFGDGGSAGRARRAPGAGSQHSRFGHARAWPASSRISARAIARGSTNTPTTSARSSAGWKSRRKPPAQVTTEGVVVPAGIPESFDEHVKLHFDLQALAFRATSRAFRRCSMPAI